MRDSELAVDDLDRCTTIRSDFDRHHAVVRKGVTDVVVWRFTNDRSPVVPLCIRGFPGCLFSKLCVVVTLIAGPLDSNDAVRNTYSRAKSRPPARWRSVQHAVAAGRPDGQVVGHRLVVHGQVNRTDFT